MNRRAFLSLIATGLVGAGVDLATVDVDRLLWVPGEKTIFLPPAPTIVRANTFVTPEWVVSEVMRRLVEKTRLAEAMINSDYSGQFTVGNIVNVRLPVRYTVNAGRAR